MRVRAGAARVSARRQEPLFVFAITSAPEALRAVLVCAQWGGILRKRADNTKANRKTNDKGLLRFVSFTKCPCEPLFMSAHLSRSSSSLPPTNHLLGVIPSRIWASRIWDGIPASPSTISRQVHRAVSEERGIRFLRLSAGRNVLLPLPSLLRMELLLVAAVGVLLREDGPSGRAGCAHKHFLKPTMEQHFVRQFYGLS